MHRLVEWPLLVIIIIAFVAGVVLLFLSATGGRFTFGVQGILEKLGFNIEVSDHIGTGGRIIALVFGIVLAGVAAVATLLGVLTDPPEPTRPEAFEVDTGCDVQEVEFGSVVKEVLNNETPCLELRYEARSAGVASLSMRADGDVGVAFELFGPNGRSLGNDTVPQRPQTSTSSLGLPRAGSYELSIVRNGDGRTEVRTSLNLRLAQPIVLDSTLSATLTRNDADGYLLEDVGGVDLEVATGPADIAVDVALTEPGGHVGAAGRPPLAYPAVSNGPHFLLVKPVDDWMGWYQLTVRGRGSTTTTSSTSTTTTLPPTSTVPRSTTTTTITTTTTTTTTMPLSTTTTVQLTPGLPRSYYGVDEVIARDGLLAAGLSPRLITVCSGSVDAGLVRQIVEEEVDEDGEIREIELDGETGLTEAGEMLEPGTPVVVKISTGNPCGG